MTNETILSFNYLIYRLNDQIDEISKIILNDTIKNKEKFSKKITKIVKSYNLIPKNRLMINKHFDNVFIH